MQRYGENMISIYVHAPEELNRLFCVYRLIHPTNATVLYVGHCRWIDVLRMPDIRWHREGGEILHIIELYPDHHSARVAAQAQIKAAGWPAHNKTAMTGVQKMVQCVETSEIWPSITIASRAHGISPSALSNHLNGRPGHRSVKGRHYQRVNPVEAGYRVNHISGEGKQ